MKILRTSRPPRGGEARRGVALLMSFMMLIILYLIIVQINFSVKTDARVTRNEASLRAMDASIESVLLRVIEDLKADGDSAAGGGADGGGDNPLGDDLPAGDGAGGGGADEGASDSKQDSWAKPQRTEMNEVRLRILIQDETSKFNVLSLLDPDEDVAEEAFERLVRVIENARKGTLASIDPGDGRRMADSILSFMNRRQDASLPKPELLSDDEENEDYGYPLSLREMVAVDIDLFSDDLFRDYRDEDGKVVHSLGSFLTVWSSLTTSENADASAPGVADAGDDGDNGEDDEEDDEDEDDEDDNDTSGTDPQAAPAADGLGQGGGGAEEAFGRINLNTAPIAVLAALIEDRDTPYGFWEAVIEYRNEEDEERMEDDEEPPLDEFGEEIIPFQFFSSVDQISEVDGWDEFEPEVQASVQSLLTVQSQVFSIYITARRPSGLGGEDPIDGSREGIEEDEQQSGGIVRTVRAVVWRRAGEDGETSIIPIVRWEVIDYVPYEVEDLPDGNR